MNDLNRRFTAHSWTGRGWLGRHANGVRFNAGPLAETKDGQTE